MKRLLLVLVCMSVCPVRGQHRPLHTESTETVRQGNLLLEGGVELLQDAAFRLSGLEGDLSRLGVFSFRLGIGPAAEFQLRGVAHDRLDIEDRFPAPHSPRLDITGNTTGDFGNLFLGGKFRFHGETARFPALGFHAAVELPNASNEKGLGNDETNAYATLLASKGVGQGRLLANLGLAILGDPLDAGAQDDLLTYGLAFVHPVTARVNLLADFYGRAGAAGVGTEEQSRLRAGAQFNAAGFYWDGAFFAGFCETDPDWGLIFGVSRPFRLPLAP